MQVFPCGHKCLCGGCAALIGKSLHLCPVTTLNPKTSPFKPSPLTAGQKWDALRGLGFKAPRLTTNRGCLNRAIGPPRDVRYSRHASGLEVFALEQNKALLNTQEATWTWLVLVHSPGEAITALQGYIAHKKTSTPLGPP